MKNLILGFLLIAFSFSISAQTKRSSEDVRAALAKGMVSFVETVKPVYKSEQTYEQFQKELCGSWKPTNEGAALLKKSHELLSRNVSSADIQNNYSGKELGGAYLRLKAIQQSTPKADGIEVFGATTGSTSPFNRLGPFKCRWWDLACHFVNVIIVIQGAEEEICALAGFHEVPCEIIR